jgi:type I restriction enzyme, S subunit
VSAPLLMLKELGTIHTGSTPKTNDESLFGGDVPFVTPGDLDAVSPIQSTPRTLTEAGVKTADLLPAESVLVCCIGSLGKIGFAGRPVVTNQQINAVVFNPAKVHARYGFFACRMLKPQLELMAPATTVPIVNKSRFSELRIPVPPLEEQRRIAAILDQAETLRTQRRQALAHLDTLTQSLFLDMFGDPRSNPKGWREAPVGALTDCIVPGRDKPKSFSGGIPWVTTANLIHMGATLPLADALGLSKAEIDEVRAKVIPAGSVIISCVGDLGVVSIAGVPMVINQQLHSFQCGAELNNLFLMHSLSFQKAFMLAKASSTTLPYMNKSVCNSIPVLVPPLPLQQTFATRIQAIEALKATHRTVLAQLDALFASLQQRAFAGDL